MNTNKLTLLFYWQQIRKHKVTFVTMLIAIPLASLALDMLLPYVLSQAVGTFGSGNFGTVPSLLTTAAILGLVGIGLNLIGFQSMISHESGVRKDLTDDTLAQLLTKDQDFFANQKIGSLTGKFMDFINGFVGLQDLIIIQTIRFILSFGVGVALIFAHSVLLGCIVLGLLIGLLIQVRISIHLRTPLRTARKDMISELNGTAADIITNNMTVKTFAHEAHEESTIGKLGEKYRRVYQKDFRWLSVEGSARLAAMSIVQIIAIAVIAHLLQTKQMQLGAAIFTVAYLQRVATQIFSFGEIVNGYDRIFLQAAPMTEILMKTNRIVDAPDAKTTPITSGAIEFSGATYRYPDADEPVLRGLDLTIPAGQKVGVVGHSGAGKTTLTRLLLRFDDITDGSIAIDGHELRDITQASLRHAISYVPQEPLLFHRSLRENIAYGKLNATDEEIRHATKLANALDFIEKLPHGFDTQVGERGVKLSGGQRQRIAIARAILKDAPVLILDEATSALDSESEKLIQDALTTLMKGRTSLVIAHRLSTIAKLDRIIVLENGRVVEDGTHRKLLTQKGIYAKLWAHQSGGFIED